MENLLWFWDFGDDLLIPCDFWFHFGEFFDNWSFQVRHYDDAKAVLSDDGSITITFESNVVLSAAEAQTVSGQFLTLIPYDSTGKQITSPLVGPVPSGIGQPIYTEVDEVSQVRSIQVTDQYGKAIALSDLLQLTVIACKEGERTTHPTTEPRKIYSIFRKPFS